MTFPYLPNKIVNFDALPYVAMERLTQAEAEQHKAVLEAAGAIVEIQPVGRAYGVPEPGLYEVKPCPEMVRGNREIIKAIPSDRFKNGIYLMSGGLVIAATAALVIWLIGSDNNSVASMGIPGIGFLGFIGVVMLGHGVQEVVWVQELNKIKPYVSRTPILRGDGFSFYYQQRFKRTVEVKSVEMSLIFREKVSYIEGKKTKTVNYDRLSQKFTRAARSYQSGEGLDEKQVFQIPDCEMGIRNLHMQLPDAKVVETGWLIQVNVDAGNAVFYRTEYPLGARNCPPLK